MNRISSETEKRIIEMWFEGCSRDDIARALCLSGSTVSAVVNSMPPCLRTLRDLSVALRKHNLLPIDALKGVNVLGQLANLGVAPEQIPFFIEAVKKMSAEAGYQPEQVIEAAIKVSEIEVQSGKKYPEAIKDYEMLTQKNKESEARNSQLELEIKENTQRRNQTLKQAKITSKEISEVNAIKSKLRKHRIDLHDVENLPKYLDNMKETGFKPQNFVALAKKHGSVQKSLAHSERLCVLTKAECEELKNSKQKLQTDKQRLQADVTNLNYQVNYLKAQVESLSIQWKNIMDAIAEAECIRQATINQTAKTLGMNDYETINLRINKQFELIQATFEAKTKQKLLALFTS